MAVQLVINLDFADSPTRASILLDFCKSENADIYTDATRTVVDPAKVQPATILLIKQYVKNNVLAYRANLADRAQRVIDTGIVNP